MSSRLIDLNETTYFQANKAVSELILSKILFIVMSTKRTINEQFALYAQGREPLELVNKKRSIAGFHLLSEKENSDTVTNCDGILIKSNHQDGSALDIVPLEGYKPVWPKNSDPRWKQISDVMKKYNFEWGGDWKKPDSPHYQIKIK